jgi:hypothetical protein
MDRRAILVLGLYCLNILLPGCTGHNHASKGGTILSSVWPCRCITVSTYLLHHACAVCKTSCSDLAVDTLGNRIRRFDDRTDQAISVSNPIGYTWNPPLMSLESRLRGAVQRTAQLPGTSQAAVKPRNKTRTCQTEANDIYGFAVTSS